MDDRKSGSFTMPGEAGYEALTLELARRWGADAIRDCEGTNAFGRYSQGGVCTSIATVCVIRNHNRWIEAHPDCRQQCLSCPRRTARVRREETLAYAADGGLLCREQFRVNDEARNRLPALAGVRPHGGRGAVAAEDWEYDPATKSETRADPRQGVGTAIRSAFFAWRVWEEISMYNHTTNRWDSRNI